MLKYFSKMHLTKVERYLQPNVEYFLKDGSENCFIGIDDDQRILVLTSETNKEPLKLVFNSDRSLSFYSPTVGKWLRTSALGVYTFVIQRSIEDASKFEPLIGADESDGVVLRTVQRWDNFDGRIRLPSVWRAFDTYTTIKFNFLPVN